MSEIDWRKKIRLQCRNLDIFLISLEFLLYFSRISYIRSDPPVGESNDLQMVWKFFPEHFIIIWMKSEVLQYVVLLVHRNEHFRMSIISGNLLTFQERKQSILQSFINVAQRQCSVVIFCLLHTQSHQQTYRNVINRYNKTR